MDPEFVKQTLIEIIQQIQTRSGLDCPPLNGKTKPHKDVPDFDSKTGIAATSKLEKKLGVGIPDDANIFANEKTETMLTLDQTVALVCKIAKSKDASGAVA